MSDEILEEGGRPRPAEQPNGGGLAPHGPGDGRRRVAMRGVEVFPRTVLTVVGVLLLVALGLWLLFLASRAVTLALVAVFLAMALNPAVELFERRGLKRGLAVAAVSWPC